jgi:methionyl-tRNA synthetase
MHSQLLTKCLLLAGLMITFVTANGQQRPMPPIPEGQTQAPGQPPMPGQREPPPVPEEIQKEMAKKANEDRQAQLRRDTENLFKLASELKQYVDKTNENTLSINVIKKADEIEKLAHSVKEKMKGQ